MVAGKTQTEQASALGVSQGEVSKRWKELVRRVAREVGLLEPIKRKQKKSALSSLTLRTKLRTENNMLVK
ncbi:hypothetical protein [Calothrix sp. NIES-3974]|uniref:hypothetical protein n=1 Tax=Calothrix sp. NIES-3974 TaxID=2005462 RepID=UPI000B5E4E30|nr:hypothetical protein [Calothrix sp. NIES-3974]BAZ05617.1 hypothetical protein NIES3974_22690 [Calothrix sp. NIES-3974]